MSGSRRGRRRAALVTLGLSAGVASLRAVPAEPQVVTLGPDLEPLRGTFNGQSGHVRAVLLVAPT